jgi:hypothetical protein
MATENDEGTNLTEMKGDLQEYFSQFDKDYLKYRQMPHYIEVLTTQSRELTIKEVIERIIRDQGKISKILLIASAQMLNKISELFRKNNLPCLEIFTPSVADAIIRKFTRGVLLMADCIPKKGKQPTDKTGRQP